MILALALAVAGFDFQDVEAWKFVEGRQDRIPALTATLFNRTGDDWVEARFRVRVQCRQGGERSYVVRLRDLVRGTQAVRETSFDSIDRVEACDGTAAIEFLDGTKVPPGERAAYVVLGFSFQAGDGPPTVDLEGLLDYRRTSDNQAGTSPVFWRSRGERIDAISDDRTAWYAFRVAPGRMGMAGFMLNRDPAAAIPSRFLRSFDLPPDTAAFLGAYHVEHTPNGLTSVLIDPAEPVWQQIQQIAPQFHHRRWVRPAILRQSNSSSVIRE